MSEEIRKRDYYGLIGKLMNIDVGTHIILRKLLPNGKEQMVSGYVVRNPTRTRIKLSLEDPNYPVSGRFSVSSPTYGKVHPTRGNRTYFLDYFDEYKVIPNPFQKEQ